MAIQREQEVIQSGNGVRPDSPTSASEKTNKEKREEVLVAFTRQFEAFRQAPETEIEDWEAAERGEMAELLDTGKIDFRTGKDSYKDNASGRTRRLPFQAFMNFVAIRADEDEQIEEDRRILERHSRSPISTIKGNGEISRQTHRQLAEEAAQATQDRRNAVRRAQTGVRWFYPPNNIETNGTTGETTQPQDLSDAMRVFEEALRKYRHAENPIEKKAAKKSLDSVTRQMGELTGDQAAVREFLEARREEARKSGKADRGTASKLEIRASKLRIERAVNKLYELEDLRNNEPIVLGNSLSSSASDHGLDLPIDSSEEIIKTSPWLTSMIEGAERDNPPLRQDEAPWGKPDIDPKVEVITSSGEFLTKWDKPKKNPIKKAQEDLHTIYLEAWRDAEGKRIARDEANPTPLYFIPEITTVIPQTISIESATTSPAVPSATEPIATGQPDTAIEQEISAPLPVSPADGAGSLPDGGTPETAEGDADDASDENLTPAEKLLVARVNEIEESYAQTLFDLTDKDNDQSRIDYLNESLEDDRSELIKLTGNEELFGKFREKIQELVSFINEKGQEDLSPEDQRTFDRFNAESDALGNELTKAALEKYRQDSTRELTPDEALDKAKDNISNLLRALMMTHLYNGDPDQVAKYEEEQEIYKLELIALTGNSETVDSFIETFNIFNSIGHKPGEPISEEAQKAFDEMKAASNHLEVLAFSKAELDPIFSEYLSNRSALVSAGSEADKKTAQERQKYLRDKLEELTGDKESVARFEKGITDLIVELQGMNPDFTLNDLEEQLKIAKESDSPTPAQSELIDSAETLEGYERVLVSLRAEKNKAGDTEPKLDHDPADPIGSGDHSTREGAVPSPDPSSPTDQRKEVFNILFTSLDPAYDQKAAKWAEQRLQIDLTPSEGRGGKIKSLRRIVATRITEEGKRQKYTKAYKEALIKTGNPYAQIDIKTGDVTDADQDRDKFEASVQATLRGMDINPEQFVARKAIVDEKIQEKISFELYGYVAGRLSPAEIEERFARFTKANSVDLRKYFGKDLDSSDFMAGFKSNLVQKLGEIREAIDNGVITLDQVNFNVGFAVPRWGTETQAELTRRDKLIKGAQKRRKTGVLANPLVLGAGASIGTSLAWGAAGWGARSVAPVVGILPGALIGGWNAKARRSYDLKRDRATFEKDQASGIKVTSDQPRRLVLDSFSRRKTSTRQLNYGVGNLIGRDLADKPFLSDEKNEQNKRAIQALISRIAEIDVRRKVGISEQTDHVMYSSDKVIQQEKLTLEELRLKAIEAVRFSGISQEDYQRILGEKTRKWEDFLARTNKAQDIKFDKYRTRESRKAFVEGAVKGAVGAGVIAAGTTGIRMASDALGIDVVGGVRNIIDERIRDIRGEIREISSQPKGVTKVQSVRIAMDDHYSNRYQVFDSTANLDSAAAPETEVAVFAQEAPVNFHEAELDGKTISIPEHTRLVIDRINGGYDLVSSRDGKTVLLDDVKWIDGKLTANPESLWIDQIQTATSSEPDIRRVLGKNGVWREMSSDIKTINWDNNGTPGKYDKDELGIFNKRDGNAVVFRIPSSSNGVFLNINGDRVWLPETRDGVVRLDPDSKKLIPGRHDGMTYGDVARIAIDQDQLRNYHGSLQTEVHTERREIFRVDTIEAGTFRDGKATIHATILGCGETPKEIKMGTITNSVTKILPGELPEPTPTPEPTPEPTPVPTPEPTPSPTAELSPSLTPAPVIPTGGGFTFEFPDLSNFQFPPTIATPMARRYPLERAYTSAPTPIHRAPAMPHIAPSMTPTPQASPVHLAGIRATERPGALTDELREKVYWFEDKGYEPEHIAVVMGLDDDTIKRILRSRNSVS